MGRRIMVGTRGSPLAQARLWPLPLTLIGLTLLFVSAVLLSMRAQLAAQRVEALLARAMA